MQSICSVKNIRFHLRQESPDVNSQMRNYSLMWRCHTLLIQQTFSLSSVLTVSIRNTYTYEFKFNFNPVYILYKVISIKIVIIIINRLPSNILKLNILAWHAHCENRRLTGSKVTTTVNTGLQVVLCVLHLLEQNIENWRSFSNETFSKIVLPK